MKPKFPRVLLNTLVGWRRSSFNQDPSRDFYNTVTGETYKLDTPLSFVRTRITEDSYNYGAVVHFAKYVGAYYNYAESGSLSSGVGGAQLTPGLLRGPLMGDGQEFGLRWPLLGGRIESNWTYFITNATKNAANPAVPGNVRQIELRSNLVTMYRFTNGPLKDFSIGGGGQFRAKSYQGNFDLDRDGVTEELWSSGYTPWNAMFAYRTKIWKRSVDLNFNINNLFDKDYFRSYALATGAWGDGRSFRCSARVNF